ncbi:MAG: methionine--tRNA ligase [Patescibacteria group bacterium]
MSDHLYFTTTLPYVNAAPHLGFALELVQADVIARAARLAGQEVFFNTGTDEHGLKIFRAAAERGIEPAEYVAVAAAEFRRLLPALNILPDANFIRTSDPSHVAAAQEFWRRAARAGDIYQKEYQVKYCVGCELEKTESELVDDKCLLHPNLTPEIIKEENYFFRFSKYQEKLLALYREQPDFVVPVTRLNEIAAFVERGLEDFSISRLTSKMPWGVPVPDDPEHTIYVWFDALVNYISAIGWPSDKEKFKTWWPVIQFAGKDNLRQQAAMWPAMLMSVGLPPPRQIVIHGFINSGGQKMSKSLGNIVDPFALIDEYGAAAVRYYLLRHLQPFEDGDFTPEKFKAAYNANLANGLGNLVSRVMALAATHLNSLSRTVLDSGEDSPFVSQLTRYEFSHALDFIWQKIENGDKFIQETKPFALIKTNSTQAKADIEHLVSELWQIACWLEPFMPTTASTIKNLIQTNQPPTTPLFPRK